VNGTKEDAPVKEDKSSSVSASQRIFSDFYKYGETTKKTLWSFTQKVSQNNSSTEQKGSENTVTQESNSIDAKDDEIINLPRQDSSKLIVDEPEVLPVTNRQVIIKFLMNCTIFSVHLT
jgi:hypothetical protein